MSSRRGLVAVVVCCLVGAGLALLAAGRTWVRYTVDPPDPLPVWHGTATGSDVAGAVAAVALVGLAGAVAVVAARGWGRVLVGLLLLAAGAVLVVTPLSVDPRPPPADVVGQIPAAADLRVDATAWPYLATAGGVAVLAAGAVTVGYGRRWSAMSARYDAPASRREAGHPAEDQWELLDRGEDPT